ncbi:putative Sodium/hydrogen exchanger 7 [Hypsibius exemplaris]|uniref:Sodium/hydrogen exchanger 7 n=1 Tax=Hypsibius exemplaris TaxID=2072580 RepID=A0A1W0WCW5_HYPEX|nr:putative Sodium/hydrogen exchanger 7 [Hypsibius exemplaris]
MNETKKITGPCNEEDHGTVQDIRIVTIDFPGLQPTPLRSSPHGLDEKSPTTASDSSRGDGVSQNVAKGGSDARDRRGLGYKFVFDEHDTDAAATDAGAAAARASSDDTASHTATDSSSHGTGRSGHGTADEHASHDGKVHAPEILYIFLTLTIGAIARYGLKMVRDWFVMPYTVFVLLLGIIYGLMDEYIEMGNKESPTSVYVSIAKVDANVLLLIFLPGLIYEAAFQMQTHLFKKLLPHMLIIGTAGLAFNVITIAYISVGMFATVDPGTNTTTDWNWKVGMLFSAVVSASDPIAAVALLKEAGSSKTLTTVLEGTSLLSDTSAVVLTKLFRKLADAETVDPTGSDIAIAVFKNVLGGPVWGLGVGFLLTSLLSRVSSVWKAELILIVVTPYLVFWAADAGFDISGALATMVLGLWMSSHRTCISPDVEELVNRIWQLICLVSNTLIFSLVGVIIVQKVVAMSNKDDDETIIPISAHDLLDLFIINIFLILIRYCYNP